MSLQAGRWSRARDGRYAAGDRDPRWLEADGLRGEPLGSVHGRGDDSIRTLLRRFTGRQAATSRAWPETRGMFHRLGVDPPVGPRQRSVLRRMLRVKACRRSTLLWTSAIWPRSSTVAAGVYDRRT